MFKCPLSMYTTVRVWKVQKLGRGTTSVSRNGGSKRAAQARVPLGSRRELLAALSERKRRVHLRGSRSGSARLGLPMQCHTACRGAQNTVRTNVSLNGEWARETRERLSRVRRSPRPRRGRRERTIRTLHVGGGQAGEECDLGVPRSQRRRCCLLLLRHGVVHISVRWWQQLVGRSMQVPGVGSELPLAVRAHSPRRERPKPWPPTLAHHCASERHCVCPCRRCHARVSPGPLGVAEKRHQAAESVNRIDLAIRHPPARSCPLLFAARLLRAAKRTVQRCIASPGRTTSVSGKQERRGETRKLGIQSNPAFGRRRAKYPCVERPAAGTGIGTLSWLR